MQGLRLRDPLEPRLDVDDALALFRKRGPLRPGHFAVDSHRGEEAVGEDFEDTQRVEHIGPGLQEVDQGFTAAREHEVWIVRPLASIDERHLICTSAEDVPHRSPELAHLVRREDGLVWVLLRALECASERVVVPNFPGLNHRDAPVAASPHKACVWLCVQVSLRLGFVCHRLHHRERDQSTVAKIHVSLRSGESLDHVVTNCRLVQLDHVTLAVLAQLPVAHRVQLGTCPCASEPQRRSLLFHLSTLQDGHVQRRRRFGEVHKVVRVGEDETRSHLVIAVECVHIRIQHGDTGRGYPWIPRSTDCITGGLTSLLKSTQSRFQSLDALALKQVGFMLLSELFLLLPRRRPFVEFAAEADANEETAQFDSRAEGRSHLEHSVAAPEPPQHRNFVCDLTPAVHDANAEKCRMWLCCDTVQGLAKCHVHPAVSWRQ
mmetsp:Transcript_1998/g.5041  ORF Transcript_1998/g.5041 Transcript_1998/m.5041 type:complete len:433 (-) Transcript_1998:1965-3263(-)